MLKPYLAVNFFVTSGGTEPVRKWLQSLAPHDRRAIGADIKTVQLGWPLGMPLVKKIADGLWEIRTHLHDRIARIFFTVIGQTVLLLHGFFKKSQATPAKDLALANARLKQVRSAL